MGQLLPHWAKAVGLLHQLEACISTHPESMQRKGPQLNSNSTMCRQALREAARQIVGTDSDLGSDRDLGQFHDQASLLLLFLAQSVMFFLAFCWVSGPLCLLACLVRHRLHEQCIMLDLLALSNHIPA